MTSASPSLLRAPRITDPAARRVAILVAQRDYLQWYDTARAVPAVDRSAFCALAGAAKALDQALQPFELPASPSHRRLIGRMQLAEGHRQGQEQYSKRLGELAELLGLIKAAASVEATTGAVPDREARVWLFLLADAWRQAFPRNSPSATPRGYLWRALDDLKTAGQLDVRVPGLTLKRLRTGLGEWLDVQALKGALGKGS